MSENTHICELCTGLSPMARDYCCELHVAALVGLLDGAKVYGLSDEQALDVSTRVFHEALCDAIKDGAVKPPMALDQHIRNTERVAKVKAVAKSVATEAAGVAKEVGIAYVKLALILGGAFVLVLVLAAMGSH